MGERGPYDVKQYLLINSSIDMTKGKVAAQCAHASIKILCDRLGDRLTSPGSVKYSLVVNDDTDAWLSGRFTKITLKVPQEDLSTALALADKFGIVHCAIHDDGRTQVEHGSLTVTAIGPFDTTDPRYQELHDFLSKWKLY